MTCANRIHSTPMILFSTGGPSSSDQISISLSLKQERIDWELAAPITISEVAVSVKRTKNSAPSPNNYRLQEVLARSIEQLTILFNIMLMYRPGRFPDGIFDSRITFIKKARRPPSPQDYRTIPDCNFITRIFHRILARRIENSIFNHPDKVGFKRIDGVGYDMLNLHNINKSWNKYKELVVSVPDIKKAFDSVSQGVFHQVRLKKGLPIKLARYITSFEATNLIIGDTSIRKSGWGVEQEVQLSPVLFNLALDTALFHLEAFPAGVLSSADFNYYTLMTTLFATNLFTMQDKLN